MGNLIGDTFKEAINAVRRRPAELAVPTDAAAASFDALTSKLDYLDPADIRRVRDAYRFADEAHLGQYRTSGEPYITHPIAVAGLCAEWKLDAQAIMAALMHDAMEDCGITKAELIERFGAPTAELVDGLTKLDKLQFSTREESQAESFRKMLLAMARDVRVILIKLADRLHNMRTMESVAVDKRMRIARETLDIYAPIAHRLGLNQTRPTASCRSCRSNTCVPGVTTPCRRRCSRHVATGAIWSSASNAMSRSRSSRPNSRCRSTAGKRRCIPSTGRCAPST